MQLKKWSFIVIVAFTAFSALGSGCGESENIPVVPPKGWDGNATYWWQIGADTTGAYRPLETMDDMGVPGSHLLTLTIDRVAAQDMELAQRKFDQYVKLSLIELFRNEPSIVDSLFNLYVIPKLQGVNLEGDVQPLIRKHQRIAYQTISRHFRYPRAVRKLGIDIPILVPDSLKTQNISGIVFLQVAVNKEGVPVAIKKLDGLHPTLDRIAMRAMTQMRWQPAFILRGSKSVPTPSWTRMKVRFGSSD